MSTVSCEHCGASFNCKPSRIKQGRGKYCSRDCRTTARGGKLQKRYSREYSIYCNAIHRVRTKYKPKGIEFKFESFAKFMEELGPCPAGLTVDRINNDSHYMPGNVRWATPTEQVRNRSNTLVYNGVPLAKLCEERGLRYHTVWARINCSGWSIEDALNRPTLPRRPRSFS